MAEGSDYKDFSLKLHNTSRENFCDEKNCRDENLDEQMSVLKSKTGDKHIDGSDTVFELSNIKDADDRDAEKQVEEGHHSSDNEISEEEEMEEEVILIEYYTVPVEAHRPFGPHNDRWNYDCVFTNKTDDTLHTTGCGINVTKGETYLSSNNCSSCSPINSSRENTFGNVCRNTTFPTETHSESNQTSRMSDVQGITSVDGLSDAVGKDTCRSRQMTTSDSPCRKDVYIENKTATGASDIQTITRMDSKTDDVVVLIRPRHRSPSPFSGMATYDDESDASSIDSTEGDVCDGVQTISQGFVDQSFEKSKKENHNCTGNESGASKFTVCPVDEIENCISLESTRKVVPETNLNDNKSDIAFTLPEDSTVLMKDNTDTAFLERCLGAKSKHVNRERDRTKSFPQCKTSKQSAKRKRRTRCSSQRLSPVRETLTDEEDTDLDCEDKDITLLLQSMRSVTSNAVGKVKQNGAQVQPDEQTCVMDDHDCDAFGHVTEQSDDLDKDKSLSERLKKKQAGGVTVITFLSPASDKSDIKFTPLKFENTKTLPVKVHDVFLQHATDIQRVLPQDQTTVVKRKLSSRSLTFSSPKLASPRLHCALNKMLENEENIDGLMKNDASTQSPFKMSATQLILPKLSLINRTSSISDGFSSGHGSSLSDSDKEDLTTEQLEMDTGSPGASLVESLSCAMEMLNSSRLDDAEKQLLKLYQHMQEKPEDNTKILVQALTALAEVCIRRSRMCRSNPMEWQWLCMHAIALLQYTSEVCDSELEMFLDNQDAEWYLEQKGQVEIKCRPLEDSFNRALYNCLKHEGRKYMDPFRSFSFPNTPSTPSLGMFPLSSGNQFTLYPSMHDRLMGKNDSNTSVDDMNVGIDWLTKFLQYCNDRIQSKNLGAIFNRLFKKKPTLKETSNDETCSVISESSCSSLDWDHGDLQGIDEIDVDMSASKESPFEENGFSFELTASDAEDDGWDFFINDRKNCKFKSVVQVSGKDGNGILANPNLLDVRENDTRVRDKELISPLHEHNIKLTLAKSYTRLADKLVVEQEYRKAEVLFEQVMAIIDEIQDGTAGMLRFSAKVMKSLGTVKSKQGKSSAGLSLLNKALETYRDLQDTESNFEIANALLELGNGYVVGKNNEDGVYDDAISAIREFFEKDFSDGDSSNSSPNKSEPSSPQKSAEEEKNIEEAIHCYKEALSLLHGYDSQEKERDAIAKSTMRLGDCYFMQKDYDRALQCFEKALSLFSSTSTLGTEFVLENAHVMCMLGVSSFMLHIYPRAATVFELALHLVKYAFGLNSTFLHGMILSLMGITFYKMKNYHRCVSMCYQAFELLCNMHGNKLPTLPRQKFWMVCQVLYVMGNSYNILGLHQKAVKYLTVARTLMMASKLRDRRQFMRVLQILGDCYFAQYDYKKALSYYNEALEYGECESQVSFDEVFDPKSMSDDMTMHNQLVSKSAEAHISMQQYQNAVHYLEQAHDIQEVLGDDIKGDLVCTLYQLGQMHSIAGDVDKAIESFEESLEVYREIHEGNLSPDMCNTLGNLASMCYVKACVCEDIDGELEMILAAEQHFQEALKLEMKPSVCVKYGNFLFSQGNYEDAILYLEDALRINDIDIAPDLVYGGLDKVTLPDCLQDEVDTQEEVVIPPTALARYIIILSHKCLRQMDLAEKHLFLLLYEVLESEMPILYSVLGYGLMELGLFEEAVWSFGVAISLENEYSLAIDNYCLCLLIWTMKTIQRAVENICLFLGVPCYSLEFQ